MSCVQDIRRHLLGFKKKEKRIKLNDIKNIDMAALDLNCI